MNYYIEQRKKNKLIRRVLTSPETKDKDKLKIEYFKGVEDKIFIVESPELKEIIN